MKPSNELFELIKSLTKNEKRYFKSNYTREENSNYIKLFEEIDKQEMYDEKEIKRKFGKEKFVKQLTFTKNYLYKNIVNSLIAFNRSKSSEIQLLDLIVKLRILFKKSLFKQYFKALKKAKKSAWKYEKFYILLELIRLERLIMEARKFRTFHREALYDEERIILKKIQNIGEYSSLFFRAQALKREMGTSGSKAHKTGANKLLKEKLLSNTRHALSSQALEYFYHIKQVLYSIAGDREKVFSACTKRLHCIERNPKPFLDDIINVRKEVLYALIELSMQSGKNKEFNYYMRKYYFTPKNSLAGKFSFSPVSNFINLQYYTASGKYKKGKEFADKVSGDLINYKGKLDRDMEIESMFTIIKFHFYSKNYTKALDHTNKLLAHPVIGFRKDIYTYSKIINILIHYELGNFELLEYLISSTQKHLNKKKEIHKNELAVIKLISKLILPGVKNDREKIMEIKRAFSNSKDKETSETAFCYLDLSNWLEKKLEEHILKPTA